MRPTVIRKELVYLEIKKFFEKYQQYPCSGFLSGMFKTSMQTINTKMHELAEDKLIVLEYKNKKFIKYKLYDDNNQ